MNYSSVSIRKESIEEVKIHTGGASGVVWILHEWYDDEPLADRMV